MLVDFNCGSDNCIGSGIGFCEDLHFGLLFEVVNSRVFSHSYPQISQIAQIRRIGSKVSGAFGSMEDNQTSTARSRQ